MDRETVIKGIDICLQRFRCGEDCPYYNTEKIGCMEQLREDALALLKRQVPTEPESFMDGLVKRYSCKTCGKHLVVVGRYRDGYCSNCGQAVKWE